jgi:preprotein translocase subunit SecE
VERREPARKSAKSGSALIRYFQDTGDELKKVAWPSRETTIRLTLVVLGTSVAFALGLGLLDILFQRLAALLAAS